MTRVLRTAEAVVLVGAARQVLGVWPTSIALAAVGLWWGLRAWQRIETRAGRTRAAPPAGPAAAAPVSHVAFARALAEVATTYLAECEAEVQRHDRL